MQGYPGCMPHATCSPNSKELAYISNFHSNRDMQVLLILLSLFSSGWYYFVSKNASLSLSKNYPTPCHPIPSNFIFLARFNCYIVMASNIRQCQECPSSPDLFEDPPTCTHSAPVAVDAPRLEKVLKELRKYPVSPVAAKKQSRFSIRFLHERGSVIEIKKSVSPETKRILEKDYEENGRMPGSPLYIDKD